MCKDLYVESYKFLTIVKNAEIPHVREWEFNKAIKFKVDIKNQLYSSVLAAVNWKMKF